MESIDHKISFMFTGFTSAIGIEAAKKSLANFQSKSDLGNLTPAFILGVEVKSILCSIWPVSSEASSVSSDSNVSSLRPLMTRQLRWCIFKPRKPLQTFPQQHFTSEQLLTDFEALSDPKTDELQFFV